MDRLPHGRKSEILILAAGRKTQQNRSSFRWGAIKTNGERIPPKAPARMLKSGTAPVLRAIRLLWGRMGAARFYVLAAASVIVLLAAVGMFHLAGVRSQ